LEARNGQNSRLPLHESEFLGYGEDDRKAEEAFNIDKKAGFVTQLAIKDTRLTSEDINRLKYPNYAAHAFIDESGR